MTESGIRSNERYRRCTCPTPQPVFLSPTSRARPEDPEQRRFRVNVVADLVSLSIDVELDTLQPPEAVQTLPDAAENPEQKRKVSAVPRASATGDLLFPLCFRGYSRARGGARREQARTARSDERAVADVCASVSPPGRSASCRVAAGTIAATFRGDASSTSPNPPGAWACGPPYGGCVSPGSADFHGVFRESSAHPRPA